MTSRTRADEEQKRGRGGEHGRQGGVGHLGGAPAASGAASAAAGVRGGGFGGGAVTVAGGGEDGELDCDFLAGALGAGDFLLLVEHDALEAGVAVFAKVFVDGHDLIPQAFLYDYSRAA